MHQEQGMNVHLLCTHDFAKNLRRLPQGFQSEDVLRYLEDKMNPNVVLREKFVS